MLPHKPDALQKAALDARALFQKGQYDAARTAFQAILAANPAYAEAKVLLSHIAYETGDAGECLRLMREVTAQVPDAPKAWAALAGRARQLGHEDEALAAYDRAAALTPKDVAIRAERAHYLQNLGRFEEADAALRKLIKRHPDDASLYRLLVSGRKPRKGEPVLRQMQKLWADPRLNDNGRVELGFALADAMDALGEDRKVFRFLDAANAAQARLAPHDPRSEAAEADAMRKAQDGADLAPLAFDMPLRPVFVVGMPRSGTTLVDSILDAHSVVTAGGEMGHARRLALRHFVRAGRMIPLRDLDAAALQAWAEDFRRLVARDTGVSDGVVTDKAMRTETVLGLIHRGLPGARIVIVHRDPRDIALSIYRNRFVTGTHRYANALPAIADAIKRFRAAVAHWRKALPDGALHELRYEDLVADPEPHARALVAAAGLDWEDGCLAFHERKRRVQTLSLAQVRQPIHSGRTQAWRRFEHEMQPFIDAWGDEPWD